MSESMLGVCKSEYLMRLHSLQIADNVTFRYTMNITNKPNFVNDFVIKTIYHTVSQERVQLTFCTSNIESVFISFIN